MAVNEIMDTVENSEIPENTIDETVETLETERVETPEQEIETTKTEQDVLLVHFPDEKVEETQDEKSALPFPQEDYKDGKLKPVRKRMLKKLLKYEFRALFPYLLTLAAVLIGLAIAFGIHIRLLSTNEKLKKWIVLTGMLYGYTNIGLFFVTYVKAHRRYKKNFFGDEGYLTFSIPASADEHILAKHISLITCVAISWAAIILGGMIVGLITAGFKTFSWIGPMFQLYGTLFKASPWNALFFTIEFFLLFIISIPLIPCLMGAGECNNQKHGDKKRFRRKILYFVIGFIAYYALTVFFFASGIAKFVFTEVGIHLFLWFIILVMAGATVWAYWYERKTLKNNLNLQ